MRPVTMESWIFHSVICRKIIQKNLIYQFQYVDDNTLINGGKVALVFMGRVCAVCSKVIRSHGPLCFECMSKHGRTRSQWPDFVRFMVSDYEKQRHYERRHPHISLDALLEREQR